MSRPPSEQLFIIRGMDCASCARTVEGGVAQLAGVERCELSFATERLRVGGSAPREQIVARVRELGYEAVDLPPPAAPAAPAPAPSFLAFMAGRLETRLALLGALLVLPGIVLHEILGWQAAWIDGLALLAMALAGPPIALSAWRALRASRELTINGLMTIAAVGAVAIGAYVEAGLVLVLFAIGEALEGYTATRARHSIRSLMELTPPSAVRLGPGGEARVPVAELAVGDRILVRPGERIPLDGVVHAGVSAVNQAPITGESRLVDREPGDPVFAGSINGEGSLELAVSHLAADSTIARMIRLVEEAQERRAPVQRFVDRFASRYTPAVVALAALVATMPPLLLGQPFWNPDAESFGWLYRGLALLVVACPCALVISTPVSLVSALSAAARRGVLVKGGAYLEALSRVQVVAFDKTGTLTAGQPAVVGVRAVGCSAPEAVPPGHCAACDELLALAGAVERRSEHPLGHAIAAAADARGLAGQPAEQVRALTGRGVRGRVGGREVLIGSHRSFDASIRHDPAHCAAAKADAAIGRTPVMVGVQGRYRGTITLADTVRESSRAAVAALRALGMRSVVMLTGDDPRTAARVGAEVGVTEVSAGLRPEEKAATVAALATLGPVAMVGDGINDAPALATASVGIAIGAGAGGTTQAMETADITLMSGDLSQLPFAIGLSRAAMRTVRVNVALSIGVKLAFIGLVLAGMGTMWLAVLADVGISLLVTLNGMRLLGYRGAGG